MGKTLLVCVPGLRFGIKKWEPLIQFLTSQDELKGADVLRWEHHCSYLSRKFASTLAESLAASIDAKFVEAQQQGSPYTDLILLGHSMGALLVRQAYLIGLGSGVLDLKPQEWASKVQRIVLFAGINRGLFPPEEKTGTKQPFTIRRWLGRVALEVLSETPFIHFLAEDLLFGSPFVTNLRLWWMRKISALPKPPIVVQLVGTEDGLVRRSDSWDVIGDPNGTEIPIPNTNHANIIEVQDKKGQPITERRTQIRKAVMDDIPPSPHPLAPGEQKSMVVFVIHGIRASNGQWVRQASTQIQAALPDAELVPATYFYFSAFDFVVPIVRRHRVRWFQDTYAYFLARYPKAEFRFLGHSNGTYLLGQSLRQLSGMRFTNVVLAGSVLPRDFDWRGRVDTKQVSKVWNHRARFDVPVAILCNAMRGMRMTDVGTGGYEGFGVVPGLHECSYHPGGHGSALKKEHLPVLASQVTDLAGAAAADANVSPCKPLEESPKTWFNYLSRGAHVLPYALLVGLILLSYPLGSWIFAHHWLFPHTQLGLVASRSAAGLGLLAGLAIFLKFF